MSDRGWELITSNKPTILVKPLLDAMMMEDSKSDRCFADSSSTDESDRGQVFGETNDPFDQLVASETGPRRRRR